MNEKLMKRGKDEQRKSSEDGCDEDKSDDVLFWINKNGFPLTDHVWNRMFDHASKTHPAGASVINVIKNNHDLGAVPIPKPPLNFPPSSAVDKKVELVQNYMNELQYNHTGTQFYDIKKYRSLASQTETAKEMIKESLPIKCLEAVILGIHLTNGIPGLERYPLGFRSQFGSNVHRHVVLAVSCNGLYGALGMSRRVDLMYKPLQFSSFADLVIDYIESYNQYWHKVDKVKIGFPISHDPQSHEPIHWKGLTINPSKMTQGELRVAVEKHVKDMKAWVRQAPLGATYAPRTTQTTNYPSPTISYNNPAKIKTMPGSLHNATDSVMSERSATSMSTANKSQFSMKNSKAFEMRI